MKDRKYYIYEIIGVKIGCSTNPKKRVEEQGFTEYRILGEFTCIYIASFMERFLQELYGYQVDSSAYYVSVRNRPKGSYGKRSEETRKRLRDSHIGLTHTDDVKRKMSYMRKGIKVGPMSEEHKRNLSQAKMGIKTGPFTDDHKSKIAKYVKTKYLCPDGHRSNNAHYRKYCITHGLDPALAVKIENNA